MVGISEFLGNLNFLGKLFYSQEEVQRYRAMIVEVNDLDNIIFHKGSTWTLYSARVNGTR